MLGSIGTAEQSCVSYFNNVVCPQNNSSIQLKCLGHECKLPKETINFVPISGCCGECFHCLVICGKHEWPQMSSRAVPDSRVPPGKQIQQLIKATFANWAVCGANKLLTNTQTHTRLVATIMTARLTVSTDCVVVSLVDQHQSKPISAGHFNIHPKYSAAQLGHTQ